MPLCQVAFEQKLKLIRSAKQPLKSAFIYFICRKSAEFTKKKKKVNQNMFCILKMLF